MVELGRPVGHLQVLRAELDGRGAAFVGHRVGAQQGALKAARSGTFDTACPFIGEPSKHQNGQNPKQKLVTSKMPRCQNVNTF